MKIVGKLIRDVEATPESGSVMPSGEALYDIVITDGDEVCYYPLSLNMGDCCKEMQEKHGVSQLDIRFEKTSYQLDLEAKQERYEKKKREKLAEEKKIAALRDLQPVKKVKR